MNPAFRASEQGGICPLHGYAFTDGQIAGGIKFDRIFRVGNDVFVRLYAVGHVGIHKAVFAKHCLEGIRFVFLIKLQEFEQIDDLMITPVADV